MKFNINNSILGILQQSIDNLHSLRKSRTPIPGRLQIYLNSSYSLKDKALNNFKEDSKSSNLSLNSNTTIKPRYNSGALFHKVKPSTQIYSIIESPEKTTQKNSRIMNIIKDNPRQNIIKKINFSEYTENVSEELT